jgi:hypothetical protein
MIQTNIQNIDLKKFPQLEQLHHDLELMELAFSEMKPGVDYGTFEGIDKPMLYKPGFERLALIFNLHIKFEDEDDSNPQMDFYRHKVTSRAYRYDPQTGQEFEVGMGLGTCSSKESKYRYRWAKAEQIPSNMKAGMAKTIKNKKTGEMYEVVDVQHWIDAYGFGSAKMTKFGARFRMDNPDVADIDNTVASQAKKRSYCDCIKTVTGADRKFADAGDVLNDPVKAQQVADGVVEGEVVEDIVDPEDVTEAPVQAKAEPVKKAEPAKSKETLDKEFIAMVIAFCKEFNLRNPAGDAYQLPPTIMGKYPHAKSSLDLSTAQRKDLLKGFSDIRQAKKEGTLPENWWKS